MTEIIRQPQNELKNKENMKNRVENHDYSTHSSPVQSGLG